MPKKLLNIDKVNLAKSIAKSIRDRYESAYMQKHKYIEISELELSVDVESEIDNEAAE